MRPQNPPAYRVLLVEDDPADAVVIAAMLARSDAAKFSVELAGSAAKAIERLDERTFDALILDLGLPDSQGLQTFERIRSASSGAPAIILTGTDDNAIALEALRAGAHEYLKKGHVVAELLNRVVVQAIQVHKSNEAAKASELRYRRLFESAKDGILILEPIDGSIVDANPYLLTLLGYEFEEVVGAKLWELGPFRDIAASKEAFEELIKDDYIRYDDLPLQARDGHIVPVEFVSNSYPVAGRKVIQCNIRDISARRASSEALRASEARYRHLVETSHDLIWEVDAAGIITFINEASTAIYGWKPAEMIGRNFAEFNPAEDYEEASAIFSRWMQTSRNQHEGETRLVRKDGEIITLHTNARSLLDETGQVVAIAGASHDITRLKAAEREVRDSEQKFRRLFETAAVGIWSIDKEARVTFANQRMAEMLGRTLDEILGAPAAMFYDATHGELVASKLKARTAGISEVYELKFKRKDGSSIWTSLATTPLFDANGVYEGAFAMVTDVTEARHAQDEQRLLSACLEQAAEGVIVTDLDGNIEYVNPAFTTVTGYSREEAIGQNARILKSDRQSPDFFAAMWRTLLRGETWSGHLVNCTKDGKEYEAEMTISPVRNSEGAIARYVALKRDVTQQLVMEKRIEQGERVASLGRVAATMAHEFNNVLMSILPFSEIVAREGKDSARLALCAHHITSAVRRGREITSEVLRFTNPVAPSLQPIELAEWLRELGNELTAVLSSKYEIEIRVPSTLVMLGDPNQLNQVFVNLANNARDAMPSGGRLVIGAAPYGAGDDDARTPVAGAARFAHISVSDDGSGMTPETLARLFEPLFTTKVKGTGIGLGVVQQTVIMHGGSIRVESELGVGTTFHLFFPLDESTGRTGVPDAPNATDRSLAGKRILLVEDEPSVAAGIAEGLEAEGASVRVLNEAKDVLQTIGDFSPHAVILDVMLPDADGRAVQKQIAHSFPTVPVLLSSGAMDTRSEASATGTLAFLQKPYSLHELHVALCDMIGPC